MTTSCYLKKKLTQLKPELFERNFSDQKNILYCSPCTERIYCFLSGYCDALELGSSTKAAVIRRGLQETMDFCRLIAEDDFKVKKNYLICLMSPCRGMTWHGMEWDIMVYDGN
jgi:NAD-dependent glycerol-3-phosphate dehydrogenase C-terminus